MHHVGFYVMRVPDKSSGRSVVIVESRPFQQKEGSPPDYALRKANDWRDFVQSEHPRDLVFVMERLPVPEDTLVPRRTS